MACTSQKKTVKMSQNYSKVCRSFMEDFDESTDHPMMMTALGVYENIRNTGDHTYGYRMDLWRIENEIIGFFYLYESSLEPDQMGPLSGTLIDGDLQLTAWTKEGKGFENWEKSAVQLFVFDGKKIANQLIGKLSLFHCENAPKLEMYDPNILLPSSEMWEVENFKNTTTWKEAYSEELKMGGN